MTCGAGLHQWPASRIQKQVRHVSQNAIRTEAPRNWRILLIGVFSPSGKHGARLGRSQAPIGLSVGVLQFRVVHGSRSPFASLNS